jgi:hypothetical protein
MRYAEEQSRFLDVRVCFGTPDTTSRHAYDLILVCCISNVVVNSVLKA